MKRTLLPVCLTLACTSLVACQGGFALKWGPPAGSFGPPATVSASVPGDVVAGAVVIGVMTAYGVRYYTRLPDGTRMPYYGVPPPDPNRRINVQDCSRPIDLEAGNLMCK